MRWATIQARFSAVRMMHAALVRAVLATAMAALRMVKTACKHACGHCLNKQGQGAEYGHYGFALFLHVYAIKRSMPKTGSILLIQKRLENVQVWV